VKQGLAVSSGNPAHPFLRSCDPHSPQATGSKGEPEAIPAICPTNKIGSPILVVNTSVNYLFGFLLFSVPSSLTTTLQSMRVACLVHRAEIVLSSLVIVPHFPM